MTKNATWRIAIAVIAVLMLSAPAALGVYMALLPTRGPVAAGMAAVGIELAYLSLALLMLHPELRPQARRVALFAVGTSIGLNVLADYSARIPGGLASWRALAATFDPLALGLAVVESAPLAGLAFALASLLHRLAEQPEDEKSAQVDTAPPAWHGPIAIVEPAASWGREGAYPAPVMVQEMPPIADAPKVTVETTSPVFVCPHCGASLATAGAVGAARRWGHCKQCKKA